MLSCNVKFWYYKIYLQYVLFFPYLKTVKLSIFVFDPNGIVVNIYLYLLFICLLIPDKYPVKMFVSSGKEISLLEGYV